MSNNLKVQITADVVDLQTKFGIAKAETQALQTEFNSLAKASSAGPLDAASQARYQQLASDLLAARTEAAQYALALKKAGFASTGLAVATEGMHGKISTATREFRALFDELSSGRTRYTPGTLAIIANKVFGLNASTLLAAGGVAALAGGLGYLAYKALEASHAIDQIDLNELMAGNRIAEKDLTKLTDQIAQLPNVGSEAATELMSALSTVHMPFEALQASARIAAETMEATGHKAEDVGKEIAKALSPDTTATQVAKEYQDNLSQAQVDAAEAADKSGNSNAILAQKLEMLQAKLERTRQSWEKYAHSVVGRTREITAANLSIGEVGRLGGLGHDISQLAAQTDPIRQQAQAWQDNAVAIQHFAVAVSSLPPEKKLIFKSDTGNEGEALAAAREAADIKHQMAEQEIADASRTLDAIAENAERAKEMAIAAAEQATNVKHQMAEQEIADANRTLNKIVADQRRADQQRLESERQVVRGIESAEDNLISGLVAGRQSFAQVAEQSALRLATKEIEVAAHAITERLMLQRAGAAAEKSVSAELGMKTVMQDAGKAAAGAYSAVAAIPYVGPFLAPAAAATAYAGVMAFEGLASLDVGTNYVPRDMVAQIHEGEAVVPKEYNPAAGGSGAVAGYSEEHNYNGDTHIHAMDSQSISRMFTRNRSALASSLVRAYRRGALR